ncbi:hypothetical protein [Endozoicomonas ascidiicola]|uniref:hypothetical protein n=1 Tax=Endozoicomonas ascidiicola TaxID=1698521 RepID=UPI00082F10F5|nr:hypothetical protein [Endozoicomonas ascidiicola]
MSTIDHQKTVIWSLSRFSQQKKAADFFDSLSSALCVYSPGAQSLYGRYSVYWGTSQREKLVVMPDFSEHLWTIQQLDLSAAKQTGIFLIPGECVGKEGFYISVRDSQKRRILLPAKSGFQQIARQFQTKFGQKFCPIVTRGDLREFRQSHPYLHLHHVDISRIPSVSDMTRKDVLFMSQEKLSVLLN